MLSTLHVSNVVSQCVSNSHRLCQSNHMKSFPDICKHYTAYLNRFITTHMQAFVFPNWLLICAGCLTNTDITSWECWPISSWGKENPAVCVCCICCVSPHVAHRWWMRFTSSLYHRFVFFVWSNQIFSHHSSSVFYVNDDCGEHQLPLLSVTNATPHSVWSWHVGGRCK